MKKLIIYVTLFIALAGMWLLLTLPVSLQEVVAGSLVSLLVLLLFNKSIAPLCEVNISFKTLLYSFPLLGVFIAELIKSNVDVALRVVNPKLPINPGIVKVATRLKSPLGRFLLANAITLTPGTLTVETEGAYYYIHWIDVSARDIEASTEKIVKKFERYLEAMFG